MFRNRRKKVDNHKYEACELTCHEFISKIVVENEEIIIKKDMENKEILKKQSTL